MKTSIQGDTPDAGVSKEQFCYILSYPQFDILSESSQHFQDFLRGRDFACIIYNVVVDSRSVDPCSLVVRPVKDAVYEGIRNLHLDRSGEVDAVCHRTLPVCDILRVTREIDLVNTRLSVIVGAVEGCPMSRRNLSGTCC